MATAKLTALVMAGGRFEGADARAAGNEIKGMTDIGGVCMIARVLTALTAAECVGRIMVVGPEAVRTPAYDVGAEWVLEDETLLDNLRVGLCEIGLSGPKPVLLIGADMAAPRAQSIDDFIARTPAKTPVTTPLISRAAYEKAFPGSGSRYLPLKEGEFTMGSQFIAPAELLLKPPPAVAAMLGCRKSQWQMARTLGWPFVFALLTRSLTVPMLERRVSGLLGVVARAVPNCAADLAFDIDDARDLAYARNFNARNVGSR